MRSEHVIMFVGHYGLGPWPCFFCGDPVTLKMKGRDKLNVHHRDGNRANNSKRNLKPSHHGCHTAHHNKGKMTPAIRAKVSATRKLRAIPAPNAGAAGWGLK